MSGKIRYFTALLCILFIYASTTVADDTSFPLRQSFDEVLQLKLELSLNTLGLQSDVDKQKLSVALVDITDASRPRLAAVNGDAMMYAASLPKIAILLGAFERIYAGEMELDQATYQQLLNMIRHSSNQAASAMLKRIGAPYLASILRSPRYRLYDMAQNGGLWVGKPYGKAKAWQRDPLHNLSHGATALQTARFYYLMETGQLVSPEFSQIMKRMLAKPAIEHKFVKGLKQVAPDALIFRKSGTWRQWHADSAIVEHNGYRYIAVALMENQNGSRWLEKLIGAMDTLIVSNATRIDG